MLVYEDICGEELYRDLLLYMLDIDFPFLSFFYDDKRNRFFDECGKIVEDIYEYMTPQELYLFRKRKEYMLLMDKNGYVLELVWPETEDGDIIETCQYMTPQELYLFRKRKESALLLDKNRRIVELIWPEEEKRDDF